MFDKIYFLGKGHELYFGPTIPHCLKFFEDAGYKCPEYDNPADFLLDLVNTTDNVYDDNSLEEADVQLISMEEKVDINDIPKDMKGGEDSTGYEKEEKSLEIDSRHEIIMQLATAYQESEYRKVALDYEIPTSAHGDRIFGSITTQFYIHQFIIKYGLLRKKFIHKWRGMFISIYFIMFNNIYINRANRNNDKHLMR